MTFSIYNIRQLWITLIKFLVRQSQKQQYYLIGGTVLKNYVSKSLANCIRHTMKWNDNEETFNKIINSQKLQIRHVVFRDFSCFVHSFYINTHPLFVCLSHTYAQRHTYGEWVNLPPHSQTAVLCQTEQEPDKYDEIRHHSASSSIIITS